MFLDKEIVTAPDSSYQGDSKSAGYCKRDALLASLRYLFGAKPLSLGQCFPGQARVPAGLDNWNKDVVGKLDPPGMVPVLISEQPAVH